MRFGRMMFGSCCIIVTDISITAPSNTSFSMCYCVLSMCILDKEWLYVYSTNITFINGMYVLFIAQFANCVGNDQLVVEILYQPYRLHCEKGRYNYNLKACLTSLLLNDSSML